MNTHTNNARTNSRKDTTLMSVLIATGLLMAGTAAALSSAETSAARMVVESARSVAHTEFTPAAMRPVLLQEPAIIVTAPRLLPATHTAKSRRQAPAVV